ncbi:hypothetical protein F4776DRAFT_655154 [Hypoxylon sp. NC0597]|nr:hypothetical protein F4776DRAFT_655154 [Hypoxylon sp. NC0597]
MKRKAIDQTGDDLNGPKTRRARLGDVNVMHDNSDYDPNADDILSDDESNYAGTSSTLPANDTPLTPLSPARKFPSDLKTIKCTFPGCEKTFNRPARLAAHLRSHKNERPYKCSFPGCDKDYIEEKHLKQHIKGSHTSEREHVCAHPNCGKSFMTATRLRRHQAVHEGQERFKCRDFPPCEQSFRKHQTLQRHILSEHLHLPPFPCDYKDGVSGDICGAGFDTAGALRRHQEKEHGEIRFWCDECSAQQDGDKSGQQKRVGFTTMSLLQAHMKQAHVNCMFCGLQCNGRSELEQHMESQHSNPKSLEERKTVVCTWPGCTKTFTKKSNLNVHIRSFHEGLRFVCGNVDLSGTEDLASWSQSDGCGESFVTKANLENHIRYVHLGYERPEQTQSAPKPKQPPSSNLLDELIGAGEKSRRTLACTIPGCTVKFAHNGELQAHLQNEHIIEQALMEEVGQVSNPMLAQPPMAFDDMMQGMANWEEENGNEQFWIGAEEPGLGISGTQGLDQDWVHEEAEMRQLIDPYPLEPLRGPIDPTLDDFQFQ